MQNFKREEQNFVIQNEINNLAFLTGEGKAKMSKVTTQTQAEPTLFGVECPLLDLIYHRSLVDWSVISLIWQNGNIHVSEHSVLHAWDT